ATAHPAGANHTTPPDGPTAATPPSTTASSSADTTTDTSTKPTHPSDSSTAIPRSRSAAPGNTTTATDPANESSSRPDFNPRSLDQRDPVRLRGAGLGWRHGPADLRNRERVRRDLLVPWPAPPVPGRG